MSVPPEQFARIAGRVNLELLHTKQVVLVGVGTVGSQIAEELANSGVGHLRLIDGDTLETVNLVRHVLAQRFVGMNKAEGMTLHLSEEISTLQVDALPRYVNGDMSDDDLDSLLEGADLIVAATDDREAQRRIGRRALALDVPAMFPALYGDDGGEVVVQRSPRLPCFLCWDGFRTDNERLRGVTALNADTLALIQLAVRLCLGILDGDSPYARLFVPSVQDRRPRQLFVQNEFGLAIRPLERRPNCPSCAVGPASPRQQTPDTPDTPPHSFGEFAHSVELATQAVLPWAAAVLAGSLGLSLVIALATAHSFGVYDKAGYVYGRALGFLLETLAITSLSAIAASWTAELLAQRVAPSQSGYVSAITRRGDYRRIILIAAVGPAIFLYLTHGFGPITPPPWWWLIAPFSICIAHVTYLTWDRFRVDPVTPSAYWIGGAAISTFLFVAAIGGLPDTTAGPLPEAPPITTTTTREPEETTEEAPANEQREILEEEAAEQEPPEWFEPCVSTEAATEIAPVTAFHCAPGKIAVTLEYFAERSEANHALFDRAHEVGAARIESSCPSEVPSVQRFELHEEGEENKGFLLCFIEDGRIHYAWTNTSEYESRYTEAKFPSPHVRAAQQWWSAPDENGWRELPIESYPSRYKPCEAAYPEGRAVEAVNCTPGEPVIKLEFFPEWRMANAYFQERLSALEINPQGRCASAIPAVERFAYVDQEGDQTSGRLLCFVRRGKLVYAWVKPTLRLAGEAEFQSVDPQPAEQWWRGR